MRLRPGWRARDEVGAEPRDDGGLARGDEHPPEPLGLDALPERRGRAARARLVEHRAEVVEDRAVAERHLGRGTFPDGSRVRKMFVRSFVRMISYQEHLCKKDDTNMLLRTFRVEALPPSATN